MSDIFSTVRFAEASDADALAKVHHDAWLNAYSGILQGQALREAVNRRNVVWWRSATERFAMPKIPASDVLCAAPEQRPMARLMVLEAAGRVVGYANIGMSRRLRGEAVSKPWGEVFELYLLPEYQGLGFGRRLFEAALAELRRGGYRNAVVWTLKDNDRAIAFYNACGGSGFARSYELFGGMQMPTFGFHWSL